MPIIIGSRDARRRRRPGELKRWYPQAPSKVSRTRTPPRAAAELLLVLSVPFRNQAENLTNLREHLTPANCCSTPRCRLPPPSPGKPTRTIAVWQGSAAQQAQEMVPDGVPVVSALHAISAASLTDLGHALGEDVLVCGDKKADKARVIELIQRIDGLRRVRLRQARDRPDHRIADRPAHRHQRALQDTRRHPHHRPSPTPPPTSAPISAAEATASRRRP